MKKTAWRIRWWKDAVDKDRPISILLLGSFRCAKGKTCRQLRWSLAPNLSSRRGCCLRPRPRWDARPVALSVRSPR